MGIPSGLKYQMWFPIVDWAFNFTKNPLGMLLIVMPLLHKCAELACQINTTACVSHSQGGLLMTISP